MVKGETLKQLARRVGYTYQVQRTLHGGVKRIGKKTTYRQALKLYRKHPTAFGIQRYIKGTDWTAGVIQPAVPNKIKVDGKEYERGYMGHHTKRTAQALARGFRKDGHKTVIRKFKGGWHVFVKFDQRKLR